MPLAKRTLPENLPLEVGTRYVIIGIEQFFDMKNGGKGVLLNTTVGLRRTTSKVVIGQLTDKGTTFPVEATLTSEKNKAGAKYQILKEDA